MPDLLSTFEAADVLCTSRRWVAYLIATGKLHAIRVGGRWVCQREDVEAFAAARRGRQVP